MLHPNNMTQGTKESICIIILQNMKAIVEKILTTYFGTWISGVDRENLHFSLLSGNFKVKDISLNQTYFDSLDMPLKLAFSHIGELNITAPISNFGAVTCILSDVYIVLTFKDNSEAKNINDVKLKKSIIEKYAKSSLEQLQKKINQEKDGVLKNLAKKVINNLELKIQNIHIRFQEHTPKANFSFGMTIKAITFLPTDENWNILKAQSKTENTSSTLHKKMKIQQLNIYWDEVSTSWVDKEQDQIEELCKNAIDKPQDPLFHISTDVRLKIYNGEDEAKPLYEMFISLNDLDLEVTKVQIQQMIVFFQKLTLNNQLKLLMKTKDDGNDEGYKQAFQKYIKQLILGQNHHNPQIDTIYSQISAAKLYSWVLEKVKIVAKQEKIEEQKKKKSGWFGWMKNTPNLEELEDEIQQILEEDNNREGSSPFCTVKLQAPEGKLRISSVKNNSKSFIQFVYNKIQVLFNISCNSKAVSFNLNLQSIQLDLVEMHKQLKQTSNILNTPKQDGQLFELTHSKTQIQNVINRNISIQVSQLILTVKPLFYKKIKQIFNFGQIEEGFKSRVVSKISELRTQAPEQKKIEQKNHISINIASPAIILPCVKSGYYLINIGTFNLDSQNQMHRLGIINTSFIYYDSFQGDQNPDYLINNMNLNTQIEVKNDNKNVKIDISEVSMNMGADDFSRLLEIYEVFSDSKAIKLNSLKDRRGFIETNKQFQAKISLKSSSGGWKSDYMILSKYFIYIYEHQNSLEQYVVIPVKGLTTQIQDDKLILEKDGKFILKYNQSLNPLIDMIKEKNIELATQRELMQLFGNITQSTQSSQQSLNLNLEIKVIRIRYHNIRPILSLDIYNSSLAYQSEKLKNEAIFSFKQLEIDDLTCRYKNKEYQNFVMLKGQPLVQFKFKSQVLQECTRQDIDIIIPSINLNWKPQVFLQFHSLYKEYQKFEQRDSQPDQNNWKFSLKRVQSDKEFMDIIDQYDQSNINVKQQKHKFLKAQEYEKHHPLLVFRTVNIQTSVTIYLFHRQTNIILSKIQCVNLAIEIVQSSSATFIKGLIDDLLMYQMGDFSSCAEECKDKPSHLILKKHAKDEKIMQFYFSSYNTEEFTNKDRIVNFLDLSFDGLQFYYYHQYTMRLFDYFFVQILCVLLESDLVIANKNLLEQLQEGILPTEEISIIGSFDENMKKFINPYFTDINISLNNLIIFLKSHPTDETYFISNISKIQIHNDIRKQSKRFQSSKLNHILHKHLWEEDYVINIQQFSLRLLEQVIIRPINMSLTYNRHVNTNLIKYLFKDIGDFDQSSYISGKIQNLDIDFSRWAYLNFIKFLNFNLLYQDLLDHLYVHNYKITKTFKPEPILVKIDIEFLNFAAKHQQQVIFNSNAKNLTLSYHRTNLLDKIISLTAQSLELSNEDHPILKYSSQKRMSLQYRIENTNKRAVNLSMDSARLLVSYPNLMVIIEWIQLESWVDTVAKAYSPEMTINATIDNFYFALKSNFGSTIFVKGSLNYSGFRNQNIVTNAQIQQRLLNKTITIEQINHPIGNYKCQLSVQLFRCTFKDFLDQNIQLIKKRSILNRTEIIISSRELLKVQSVNNIIEPSSQTMIFIPSLNLDFSMTDILLFQKMTVDQEISEKTKNLISKIKQEGHEVQIQKQIFNSVVLTIAESTIHFINNVGDCFVPLFTAQLSQFHTKINYNKQVVQATISLNPVLKYYNIDLITWEPFLQNCQLSIESNIQLSTNKKIVKVNLQNNTMITISRVFLRQIESINKIINKLEEDKEQFMTVQHSNSVIVINHTGYEININQQTIMNGQELKIKIPFENKQIHDKLSIELQEVQDIEQNILHSQTTKKYYVHKNNQKFTVIVQPIIKDLKKYVMIKGLYQIQTKEGETKYLPFDQNPENITHNCLTLNVSKLNQKQIDGNIYHVQRSKQSIIIFEKQSQTITNCLPIPVRVNKQIVKPEQTIGYTQLLEIELLKQEYQLIGEKHKYLKCESYIVAYDNLTVIQNSHKVNGHEVSDQSQFIQNIFIVKNNDSKIELIKGQSKIEIHNQIGKGDLKIEDEGVIYEYSKVTTAKPTSAGVQKVTMIVPKYVIVNSTPKSLTIQQDEEEIQLNSKERKIFNFNSHNKNKVITVHSEEYVSKQILLENSINGSIVLRSEDNTPKVMCVDFILSDDITFINFSEETAYKIKNQTQLEMVVYQQCNVLKEQYHFIAEKVEKPFGLDYSKQGSSVYVKVISNETKTQKIKLIDMSQMIFELQITIDGITVYLNLGHTDGCRVLSLMENPQNTILEPPSIEIEMNIFHFAISLIGRDTVRKQLLYIQISDILFKYQYSKNQLQIDLQIQRFNIQNSRDPLAKFIDLISSKKQPFLQLSLQQDMDSPKVINYFGLSINQLIVSLSSVDINVLKTNYQQIAKAWISSNTNQNIIEKQIDSSNRYYIDKMEIHPIKATVSYKSQGSDNSLLKTFANIQQASLKANGVCLTNLWCRQLGQLSEKIIKAYLENVLINILPLLGNIAILGRPASLISKIGTGFKQFIELPVEGFTRSPLEGGKGLTMGTKSLIKNTLEGTMNSVGGISQSLGSGIATLTADEEYEKQRQQILNRRSNCFLEGFLAGGQSLYKGIESGVKGVISHPIKGAQEKGVKGFLVGSLKGITGLALKPISGVFDMTSKTFEGIKNQSQNIDNKHYHHFSRVFYTPQRQYRTYNKYHSKLNQKLVLLNQQLKDLSWLNAHQINNNQTLILTYQHIIIYDSKKETVRSVEAELIETLSESEGVIQLRDSTSKKIFNFQSYAKPIPKIIEDIKKIINYHSEL